MDNSFDFSAMLQIHAKKHKNKPEQFVSVAGGVKKRLESNIRHRKSTRFSVFDKIRNLPSCESPVPIPEIQKNIKKRRMQLEKWKEEKEKKKKEASLQKKKPFLAGMPHNPLKFVPPPAQPMPSTSGRVTRLQSVKNTLNDAKKNYNTENIPISYVQSLAPKNTHTPKKKCPTSVNSQSISVDLIKYDPTISKLRTPRKSWRGKQEMVTPKNVPKSKSNSEEKVRSPKLIDIPMTPKQISKMIQKISPCVTLSCGKENARKEMKKKLSDGLLDGELCEMNVEHFRRQLDAEISRMTGMCEVWDKILNQTVLPESVQEAVLCAVGQTRLLMSQKLKQFATLLSRCEHPTPNTGLVTPTDLQGFWDVVFMQIENVDKRFRQLEELHARDWSEESVLPNQPDAARPAPRSAAASSLKEVIAAARKAKQAQVPSPSSAESKTLDMGFFCIQSPVKPLLATPTRPSLLKAVLSNETEKSANRNYASLAMLRASLLGRQVQSEDSAEEEPNLITFTPVRIRSHSGTQNSQS